MPGYRNGFLEVYHVSVWLDESDVSMGSIRSDSKGSTFRPTKQSQNAGESDVTSYHVNSETEC